MTQRIASCRSCGQPTVEDTALFKDKLFDDELDLILVPIGFVELQP